jgi:MerR family transcriptional regulator, redox-sensitive transcriptional activator SoxR
MCVEYIVLVKVGLMSRPTKQFDPAPELISIGDVSRRSGKAASAIRYYEEVGLLPAAQRVSGRRRYPPETVRTLAIIETAQRAGLNLQEIRWLFEASPSPSDAAATERLPKVADRNCRSYESRSGGRNSCKAG